MSKKLSKKQYVVEIGKKDELIESIDLMKKNKNKIKDDVRSHFYYNVQIQGKTYKTKSRYSEDSKEEALEKITEKRSN